MFKTNLQQAFRNTLTTSFRAPVENYLRQGQNVILSAFELKPSSLIDKIGSCTGRWWSRFYSSESEKVMQKPQNNAGNSSFKSNKVHIVGKIPFTKEQLDYLHRLGVQNVADSNPTGDVESVLMERIKGAEVVVCNISTPISEKIIEENPQLKFIQTYSTGLDFIDLKTARAHGIKVANVPGFSTEAVAEATLGLMLMGARRFVEANRETLTDKTWLYTKYQGTSLQGKRVCLIGNGRISKRVAELLAAFNVGIDVVDSKTSDEELKKYLSRADFVSLHCPLNDSTRNLISRKEFEMMNGAIIVNTARGGIINEEDLIWALDHKKVKFAMLDVLEHEPIRKNEPLLQRDDVFITPHTAWHTRESVDELNWRVIKNIERFLNGTQIDSLV